jgi:Kinesin motor domain
MLVDLAGSECISNTKVTGTNKQEGASINKSLLSLSKIIKTLSKNNPTKDYINYRDSKLTRIFEPILNGSCKTIVICTVSPLQEHLQESVNTLRFGMDAGAMVLKFRGLEGGVCKLG